ncbi:MAG: lipid-transfer protein [Deltaproteobacteria bacterium]|nr:lipid-transfer protein [Deltaproteobacteria bacterium]
MADPFPREVYIAGVGMTAFGRHEGKRVAELGQEAVKAALADAGLDYSAVEIAYCGHVLQGTTAGQKVLYGVGMTGIPIFNIENACASGTSALRAAAMAVGSGMVKVALAVGFEVMGRGAIPTGGDERLAAVGRQGVPALPALFANLFLEHSRRYGTTIEQLAMVSVKNRNYGAKNPRAQFHDPVTVDGVMASREVAPPLRLFMCCPTSSGAAAAVVTSADVARGTRKPIRMIASALQSDPALDGSDSLAGITAINTSTARAAYAQAGIGPEQLDCAEVHDCFSIAEIVHYENLGLCARGEGGRFIEQGLAKARVKMSTSGGLLAKGHPLGATGVAQVVEATEQLRGESGERQVPNARLALTHCQGFGGAVGVHIFTQG